MSDIVLRATQPSDRTWISDFIVERWGTNIVVAHGVIYHPYLLPGFVALRDGETVGLVTYFIEEENCEIVTIDSLQTSLGVGTVLLEAVRKVAQQNGCGRIWLITTNDNLNALRFYQKRGFMLAALHRNALEASRKLKPEIPLIGDDGIPLRDELELELIVTDFSEQP